MTGSEFKDKIKIGLKGGYLFFGEEDYLKQYYLNLTRKNINPDSSLATFNHIIFTENNFSYSELENAFMGYPIMSEKKLIEIQEVNFSDMKEADLKQLCDVLSLLNDYDYVILIIYVTNTEFNAGSPKMPSKDYRELSKYVEMVNFEKESATKLNSWAQKHFTHSKIKISSQDCTYLIEYCGRNMLTLIGEIDKLCNYALCKNKSQILKSDIDFISSNNKEIDTFDFANAILDRKTDNAFYILADMKFRQLEPIFILSSISKVYLDLCMIKSLVDNGISKKDISTKLKMHEYRVGLYIASAKSRSLKSIENAISYCYDSDILLKSSSIDNYIILERLIVIIANL